MLTFQDIEQRREKLSVVGLGYVGMPIAIAFSKKADVIGFDTNSEKVKTYKQGKDPTKEVGDDVVRFSAVEFTADESRLKDAKFHIVAVPTPINGDKTPNLEPLKSASSILGRNLREGSIVVFESTVYPGTTEDICVPILEKESGLKCGREFKIGYSPERINPGDKIHRLETITKIVSGMDQYSLNVIAQVYEMVIDAGVYRAGSIKVAEAAKVIENSQRDINIAFMNELSMIFHMMEIDTLEVLEAAGTKWNFLDFKPGLVGGHCIGIDPYYLTYKASQLGYYSQIILAGRRINDNMGKFIAENAVKRLIQCEIPVKNSRVAILGFTFKENCQDPRNSRVIDIIKELRTYGIDPLISDPCADAAEVEREYGITLLPEESICNVNVVIIAVAHKEYFGRSATDYRNAFGIEGGKTVLMDLKGCCKTDDIPEDVSYWRL